MRLWLFGVFVGYACGVILQDGDYEGFQDDSGGDDDVDPDFHNHRPNYGPGPYYGPDPLPPPPPPPAPRPPAPRPKPKPKPKPPVKKPKPPAKPKTKCPAGWTRVQRKMGGWCVRVFKGMKNQAESEKACQTVGAVLSGAETDAERKTIAELGRQLMITTSGLKIGTVRMGLRRATRKSPWIITDGHTSGWKGIKWSPGEPGNGHYSGFPNNCGLMWMWVPGGQQIKQRVHGQMFSMVCPKTWPGRWRGFVCGKKAT